MLPTFDHLDRKTWLGGEARKGASLVPIIAPSILACDMGKLVSECETVLASNGGAVEWLHVDVMDGHFVPNISFGMCVVESLRRHFPHAFLDVHHMVSEPEKWVVPMAKAGASQYTFHFEATQSHGELCGQIRGAGMQCGIALQPKTEVTDALRRLIDAGSVDMVLIMTVQAGFGGQSFMPGTMEKVKVLRQSYPGLTIEVDGGLNLETVPVAAKAGANAIVAGTSIFKASCRRTVVEEMRSVVEQHL